ncbi:MAG: alpha/beta fold hydrolase [Clostridia bacterium]|nr:alpha/beta fold hydrolase [Clostridia bacterium]
MYENDEFYLESDGIRIHAKLDFPREQKDRMPLLIVFHGLTGDMEERHITAVAEAANREGFASLRVELYGHGKSGGELKNHTILIWLAEGMRVIEFASRLPFVTDLYVAGHSQGGLLAVLLGSIERDRIKALIPLSPAVSIPESVREGRLFDVTFDPERLPETIRLDTYELSSEYVRAMRSLPVSEAASSFKKPVLIVHGTEDETIPFEYAEKIRERYENARLVPVEGDTHCFDRHLDAVVDVVGRFLRETEA